MIKLDRDLVFMDLEATGLDTQRDRIVQVALVRLSPDGRTKSWSSLVNPDIPIPPEAAAIHHIFDIQVLEAPKFWEIAQTILEFLEGADLGGYGVTRFDLPLLAAEFKRAGMGLSFQGRRIIDALTIFRHMEPRNLTAAYRFFCGKTMEGAHDASVDAAVSLEVFLAQVERYQNGPEGSRLPSDIQGLHNFCAKIDPKNVDARGKFAWRYGSAAFNFGKYQTKLLEEVVRFDPAYVEWLVRGENTSPEVAEICRRALRGVFPRKE